MRFTKDGKGLMPHPVYQTTDIKKTYKEKIIEISAVKLQTKSTNLIFAAFTEPHPVIQINT